MLAPIYDNIDVATDGTESTKADSTFPTPRDSQVEARAEANEGTIQNNGNDTQVSNENGGNPSNESAKAVKHNDLNREDISTSLDDKFAAFQARYADMMKMAQQALGVDDFQLENNMKTDNDVGDIKVVRGEDNSMRICLDKSDKIDTSQPLMMPSAGDQMKCVLPWNLEVDNGSDVDESSDEKDIVSASVCGDGGDTTRTHGSDDSAGNVEDTAKVYLACARRILKESRKRNLVVSESTLCGAAKGVFALKPISQGDTVMYYQGRLICKDLGKDLEKDTFERMHSARKNALQDKKLPKVSRLITEKIIRSSGKNTDLVADGTNAREGNSDSTSSASGAAVSSCSKLLIPPPPPKTDRAYRYMMELDALHDMDGGTGGSHPFASCLAAYSNSSLLLEDRHRENMLPILDHTRGLGTRCVKFVATRDIGPGEELLWDYKFANCKDDGLKDPVYEILQTLRRQDLDELD